MTPEEKAALERENMEAKNDRDLAHIEHLEKNPAFQEYWLRRLRERSEKYAEQVLNVKTLNPDERDRLSMLYREDWEIFKMLESDKQMLIKQIRESRKAKKEN